jgi:hypothetical protein
MAEDYSRTYKYGDTGEPLRVRVKQDSNQKAPDWTGYAVQMIMFEIVEDTGVLLPVVDAAAGVELPAASSGVLVYAWAAGDTDRVGRFPALFRVTKAGEPTERYPRKGYIWINIEASEATP